MDSGSSAAKQFPAVALNGLMVNCTISDIAGNGHANGGDYFTLTTDVASTFSYAVTYTVTTIFDPTGAMMASTSFTG